MAHFARLENNRVSQVIVVSNFVIKDDKGVEQESIGIAFCKSLYGDNTEWKQASYNGSFRGKYPCIGDKYDPELDEFVTPTIEE